jgi:hypothetical protein
VLGGALKACAGLAVAVAALLTPAAAFADHGVLQAIQAAGPQGERAIAGARLQAAQAGGLEAMRQTPGSLELVGHSPLLSRGMNAALAVRGDYAYVGSRTDGTHVDAGVLVVNVADPSHPTVVNQIGPPLEGNVG